VGAKHDSAGGRGSSRQDALAVQPDDLLTLIYTSGTTGNPKGVMLTHDNVYSNCIATQHSIPLAGGDVALSFLPLSHIFERMGDYYLFANGVTIAYAESIDTVPINMQEVSPTLMMSVPRLYEKIYARVLENAVAAEGSRRASSSGRARGRAVGRREAGGPRAGGLLALQYGLAQKLVFSKLKERTGGRCASSSPVARRCRRRSTSSSTRPA
jgi:long-chain acyl-CoA synthetase